MSIHPMPGNLGRCKHGQRVAGGDCSECEAEDITEAVAAEREACARLVEEYAEECRACCDDCGATFDALQIAAERIRARGAGMAP